MDLLLIYSKYSRHCIDLISIININGINLSRICIDEPRIREQVLTSPLVQILVVPCILVPDGSTYTKYEGDAAFKLVNTIIAKTAYTEEEANQNDRISRGSSPRHAPRNAVRDEPQDEPLDEVRERDDGEDAGYSPPPQREVQQVHSPPASKPPRERRTMIGDIIAEPSEPVEQSSSTLGQGHRLKPTSKETTAKGLLLEKERNAHIEPITPERFSGMKLSSLSDNGIDISKGMTTVIESVKTGAPINVNKLMSSIEDRPP